VSERYDPEVWIRLPFWVREILEIMDDTGESEDQLKSKKQKRKMNFRKRGGGGSPKHAADDEHVLVYQTQLDNNMTNSKIR